MTAASSVAAALTLPSRTEDHLMSREGTTVRCPGLAPAGSGGLGGAVVRLDAVLAEQAAHPVKLAVHALVLGDDGLDVDSCRPLLLQAQLVGTQLIFPVRQGRGGLQVFGVKRGFPLPLNLGELLHGVGEPGRNGRADQGHPVCPCYGTRAWSAPSAVSTWAAMPWPSRSRASRRCPVPTSL